MRESTTEPWPARAIRELTSHHGNVIALGDELTLLAPMTADPEGTAWVAEVQLGAELWDTLEVDIETDVRPL